jgi:hypothetical protein
MILAKIESFDESNKHDIIPMYRNNKDQRQ